jgi:nucleoside-diphosphate-sugar epimerase
MARSSIHGGSLLYGAVAALVLVVCFFQFQGLESFCEPEPSWVPPDVKTGGSKKMTTLVTGGLGFIGSHVVEELVLQGYNVLIYDDESNGHNFNNDAAVVHGDIKVVHEFRQLEKLDIKIDYIIHLAAAISVAESMTMPDKYNETNIQGSAKVFFWALSHGVKHVVAASSAAVYGDPPSVEVPIKETNRYRGDVERITCV